jgi:branched-chain amino acid aminotransferase
MIYLNGKFLPDNDAKIEPTDRGFLLSDGLFETIRVYEGQPFCLKEHWERLQKGAACLDLPIPLSFSEFEKIVQELLARSNLTDKNASLRLTITRGSGPRGLLPPVEQHPTVMLAAFPLLFHAHDAVSVSVSDIRRNEFSPLANIKSLSYLDNILARKKAVKNGFGEAILLNTTGNIAETTAANVFIVTDQNELVTPRLQDGALPGITRQVVLDLAKELKLSVTERAVSPDDLFSAREVFLTNSIIEIQSVNRINNRPIPEEKNGITSQLKEAFAVKIFQLLEPKKNCKKIINSILFKMFDQKNMQNESKEADTKILSTMNFSSS